MIKYETGCYFPHRIHVLKIQDNYMLDLERGIKTFELRYNDRDYKEGEFIHFVRTNGEEFHDFEDNLYRITYVLKNVPEYGLREDHCILSIRHSDCWKFVKEVTQ